MSNNGFAWRFRAVAYRRGTASVVLLVALVGVAASSLGPFYERAVDAAQLRATLSSAGVSARGVSLRAGDGPVQAIVRLGDAAPLFDTAVLSTELPIESSVGDGRIVSRDGQCQHLRFVIGGCPTMPGGVAVSQPLAARMHWTLGTRLIVVAKGLQQYTGLSGDEASTPLTVAAIYRPFAIDDPYWFGHPYSTAAGITAVGGGKDTGNVTGDAFFARASFPQDLFASLPAADQPVVQTLLQHTADLALRADRVHLDDLPALRRGLAKMHAASGAQTGSTMTTALPQLLDEVDAGRHQARAVVPALAGELALLVLVVVGLVVVSAVDQRSHDVALARLRGASRRRAAGLVSGDLNIIAALGAPLGLALAWLLCWAGCRTWLGGRATPEWRWPVFAAAAVLLCVELLIIAPVAWRRAGRPVHELLHRVPRAASRRGLTITEAVVAAGALGGITVVATGAHSNALAAITPALVALLAGLALSRVVGAAGAWLGGRATWRGRLGSGLAGLQMARRPGTRRVIVLVCVAAALAVAAADEWAVAAANRHARAAVEAGAPVVLTVNAASTAVLRQAVSAADPSGSYATPVIRQVSPNASAPVFAVNPTAFGRIAGWGWPANRPPAAELARLHQSRPPPITVTGTHAELDLTQWTLTRERPADDTEGTPQPVYLSLNLMQNHGRPVDVRVGPLPEGTHHSVTLSAGVPCQQGCSLTQVALLRATADTDVVTITATIAGLSAGPPGALRPVPLGHATDWAPTSPDQPTSSGQTQRIRLTQDGAHLRLAIVHSFAPAVLQHLDIPVTVPALVAGTTNLSTDPDGNLIADNIDGLTAAFTPVGTMPLIPGAGGPALLIDLTTAALVATPGLSGSSTEVWLARDDPSREKALIGTLAQRGITVQDRDSEAAHRAVLAASAPAWAAQFALVAAVLAVVLAALIAVLTAAATRHSRAHDAAALRLTGLRRPVLRRATYLEHGSAIVAGVVVGAVVGVAGARLALPYVPIFLVSAATPAVLRPTAWGTILIAAGAAMAALVLTAVMVSHVALRRIGSTQREGPL